jgi:energy-coupling factor transporter transmembrane protein EcfT
MPYTVTTALRMIRYAVKSMPRLKLIYFVVAVIAVSVLYAWANIHSLRALLQMGLTCVLLMIMAAAFVMIVKGTTPAARFMMTALTVVLISFVILFVIVYAINILVQEKQPRGIVTAPYPPKKSNITVTETPPPHIDYETGYRSAYAAGKPGNSRYGYR